MNIKKLAQVSYKPSATKPVVTEDIWIQNFPTDHKGNHILMQLFMDTETNKPVTTKNQDGKQQYQVNIYGTETYAYVPVTAMKALKALGLAKDIDGKIWVQLTTVSMVPTMAQFNSAPAYK